MDKIVQSTNLNLYYGWFFPTSIFSNFSLFKRTHWYVSRELLALLLGGWVWSLTMKERACPPAQVAQKKAEEKEKVPQTRACFDLWISLSCIHTSKTWLGFKPLKAMVGLNTTRQMILFGRSMTSTWYHCYIKTILKSERSFNTSSWHHNYLSRSKVKEASKAYHKSKCILNNDLKSQKIMVQFGKKS